VPCQLAQAPVPAARPRWTPVASSEIREMQKIRMKMDDVEGFGDPRNAVQHHQVMRQRIFASRIETQRGARSVALVTESPLANRVTSRRWRFSSSVRYETTRSVPP
jgi:hypothetical protein